MDTGSVRTRTFISGAVAAALLATQVAVGASPSAAEVCLTTAGPATGPAYTVALCVQQPSAGEVLTGTTEMTATATVNPPGAAVVDRVNFWWGPGTSPTYLLADHDEPYRMVLDTRRFPNGSNLFRARVVMVGGFATNRLGATVTLDNVGPPPPDGRTFTPRTPDPTGPDGRFRLVAVGDGVDGSPESESVAGVIDAANPDAFAYMGDVYDRGTYQEFDTWYSDPNGYGKFTDITNPAVGNHEYMDSATAAPYFAYWDEVPHYYSYDAGGWHIAVLDSTTEFAQLAPGTPQYEWLAADLAANKSDCTVMYAHHARWTNVEGVNRFALQPIWEMLVDGGADLILAGHAHTYERWKTLDRLGDLAPEGITQFVVGTGGRPILNPKGEEPRVAAEVTTPGALVLDLGAKDAQFQFKSADGQFTDSGTVPCRTAPEITPTVTSMQPGDDGWHRGDVSLTWQVSDPESTVTSPACEEQRVTADQPPTTYTCTASSMGGTATRDVVIKRDGTAPTIAATTSPAAPDGANGWYVRRPTVTFSCDDALSGMAHCPSAVDVEEGVSTVTRTARDTAGNTTELAVGPLSVDLTDPNVSCDPAPDLLLRKAGATVSATVADAGSGPARSRESVPVPTETLGSQTAAVTGTDIAGRTSSAACAYRVVYGFSGWGAPVSRDKVNVVRAGQSVPLKWRVFDGTGSSITTLTGVRVTTIAHACEVVGADVPAGEVAIGKPGLQNLGGGKYQYDWKTERSYAGTCRTMQMDLGDGLLRTAEFRFT